MKKALVIMAAALALAGVLIGAVICRPVPENILVRPTSPVVTDRQGKPLRIFLSPDDKWRFHVDFSEISPLLVDTVIAYEDKYFYYHPGVNPFSLARALLQNLREGRIVSGGSTLTMQIARMTVPKERTYSNKLKEIILALRLETRHTKQELIEIYFNLVPYGGNIEGVGAASWMYFGKGPERLSLAEAALLAAIPRSPEETRPDRFPQQAKRARDKVLRRLIDTGKITENNFIEAITR